MIQQNVVKEVARYRAFCAAMLQLAGVGRRGGRGRGKRSKRDPLQHLVVMNKAAAEDSLPDPVRVAVLAIDKVAAASMRAAFTGAAVNVAAPDEATAAILRAALAETGRNRATDRLIRVTVAARV